MIYLDAGATTLQKPQTVSNTVAEAVRTLSSPGRGSSQATRNAERVDYQCRQLASEMFDVDDPTHVVFTFNATHGLNIAIFSLVHPGSRVVISGYEHNAVTRPLHSMADVEMVILDVPLFQPEKMVEQLHEALTQKTDAVIINHVSNVFGNIAPVEEMAKICREKGVPLIVDASQSAGILPLSVKDLGAAFVAMPGHKGLYGPQGTGLLLCGERHRPLLYGGTGSASLLQIMPEELPDRLEAGTHNMPGIAGLYEGLKFVKSHGVDAIRHHEQKLVQQAIEELKKIPGIVPFYDSSFQNQTGALSFIADGTDCEELSEKLAQRGIALRAGYHCAPLAHRTAKTLKTGTIRMTPSVFNTPGEIRLFAENLRTVLR